MKRRVRQTRVVSAVVCIVKTAITGSKVRLWAEDVCWSDIAGKIGWRATGMSRIDIRTGIESSHVIWYCSIEQTSWNLLVPRSRWSRNQSRCCVARILAFWQTLRCNSQVCYSVTNTLQYLLKTMNKIWWKQTVSRDSVLFALSARYIYTERDAAPAHYFQWCDDVTVDT